MLYLRAIVVLHSVVVDDQQGSASPETDQTHLVRYSNIEGKVKQ